MAVLCCCQRKHLGFLWDTAQRNTWRTLRVIPRDSTSVGGHAQPQQAAAVLKGSPEPKLSGSSRGWDWWGLSPVMETGLRHSPVVTGRSDKTELRSGSQSVERPRAGHGHRHGHRLTHYSINCTLSPGECHLMWDLMGYVTGSKITDLLETTVQHPLDTWHSQLLHANQGLVSGSWIIPNGIKVFHVWEI